MNDHQLLGISNTASKEEIKKAFRRLAHVHHPDKAGGDAKRFSEISAAYTRLMNEDQPPPQYQPRQGSSTANDFWSQPFTSGFWEKNPFDDVFKKQQQYQQQSQSQQQTKDEMWEKYRNDELRRQVDTLLGQMTNVRRMVYAGKAWINYTN